MIDLSNLIGSVTLTKYTMETVLSVPEVNPERELHVLVDLKDAYFQILIHLGVASVFSFCSSGTGVPILDNLRQPFHSSPGLY